MAKEINIFNGIMIDPGVMVQQTSGKIFIPPQLQAPTRIGRCVSRGDADVGNGDWVVYHMEKATDINYRTRRPYMIDDKLHLLTDSAFVHGKINPKSPNMAEIKELHKTGLNKPVLDYENDVTPLGPKVFVRLQNLKQTSDGGVILPELRVGRDMVEGIVINMGPEANRYWRNKGEVKVGDTIRLSRLPVGGELGLTKEGEKIWRCNGSDITMKKVEADDGSFWKPVGGYVLIQPLLNGMKKERIRTQSNEVGGFSAMQTVYKDEKSGLLLPQDTDFATLVSTIVAFGDGVTKDAPGYKHLNWDKQPFHAGQKVIHTKLTAAPGAQQKYIGGVMETFQKGEEEPWLLIPSNMLEGTVKQHVIENFVGDKAKPMLSIHDLADFSNVTE